MEDSISNNQDKKPAGEDKISADLRTALWNEIYLPLNKNIIHPVAGYDNSKWSDTIVKTVHDCWKDFFKLAIDTIPSDATNCLSRIKDNFFKLSSKRVYNFLEFLANSFDNRQADPFRKNCNKILERESTIYRFVEKKIVKITSEFEIESIERAFKTPYQEVNDHINSAIRLLSDKSNPDYRNSIKESISAVEALVRIIQNDSKKTLSELLKQKKLDLHPAFRDGLDKIYGYTSDESGVRHSLTDDGREVTHADALFIGIICSAFVNYIIQKHDKTL